MNDKQTKKISYFQLFSNFKFITVLFILFALIASLQAINHSKKEYVEGGIQYTEYNNYIIFKQSYFHLIENEDLYIEHPSEYWDLYKYSPTFSLFFSVFAYLPDSIGLILWNLINALLLVFSIYLIPKIDSKTKALILLVTLIELLTSMQNEQSNGLIAGLIILALALLERKHYFFATLCIVFSVYIKLFGIVALALYLLYPQKGKLAVYTGFWCILLFLLPLLIVDLEQFQNMYISWGKMLSNDHTISHGYSVMGWLQSWFGIQFNKMILVALGAVTFCIPFLKFKMYKNFNFRLLMLSSVLLWIVIFNHKAESPTFIIAMAGVSIWFFISDKNKLNILLFILAIVFTSLSPTDLFPRFIRNEWLEPYTIKALPCIFIWFKVIYDLMKLKESDKGLDRVV